MTTSICPTLCSHTEFARLINASTRRVAGLVAEGVVLKEGRKILAEESLRRYLEHLRKTAASRHTSAEEALRQARGDLLQAQNRLLDHRLAKETSGVLTHAEIEEGWGLLSRGVQRLFDALPGELAKALGGLNQKDRRVVAAVVRDAKGRLDEELEVGAVPGRPFGQLR